MGIEEKLPSGVLLTTVEGVAGYMRKASFWPATFGLACCAIEMMTTGGPKYDLARFGMEVFRASPRQADLMIVAGRVSQKMAPVLRQIYDQMAEPKWVLAMGVCASSGGMFNNYAIVQGVDHVVPVDMYLPGCPPRPEMLIDAILKLHDQVQHAKLGANRRAQIEELETAALKALPTSRDEGPAAVTDEQGRPRAARSHRRTSPATARASRSRPSASAAACSAPRAPATPAATAAWSRRRLPRRGPAAVRRLVRRGGRRAARRPVAGVEPPSSGRHPPRRDHLPRPPRGPARRRRSCCATTRRCASSSAPASAACTTPTTPAASCTPSTTCSR